MGKIIKKVPNIWFVSFIAYQVFALIVVIKYLPIFFSEHPGDAIIPLVVNGVIVLALYFAYMKNKVKKIVAGLDLDSYEKTRKYGVDAFGVTAYKYRDM